MTELITTNRLTKRFGDIAAVNGISLSVRKGEVLGFLGPNGAGKSTTMKMITGFLTPDAGEVVINGLDIQADPIAAKKLIGYLPEGAPAYGDMTPRSFLQFVAEIRGFDGQDRTDRVEAAVAKTGLQDVMDQKIDTLSKGFKRRVGIAQAILHDPPVLIMDEPTDGLDPNQKHHVRTLISEMAADKAIIVSTHILEEVEAVCSRAVVIDKGRVVADGTAEELQQRLPYHNAVAIVVAEQNVESVRGAIGGVSGVKSVEEASRADGQVKLHALPNGQDPIVGDVAAALRAKAVDVDQIYVERGRLDDVFRQITTSDQAGAPTDITGGAGA